MIPAADFARVFGPRDPAPPGRTRFCRTCEGWHSLDRPWPHNCRDPAPPRAPFATPMLAPRFGEFVAGTVQEPVILNDRRQKRDFMERHDLVEWDAGVTKPPEPTPREWKADFVADFKRAMQEDPLARPPAEVIGRADLDGAPEIDTTGMEVAE